MTRTKFGAEFLAAARQSPRLFFAPVVGAVNGVRSEANRISQENRSVATSTFRAEFSKATRQAPRIFFSPLIGAIDELRSEARRIRALNKSDATSNTWMDKYTK